MDREGLSEKVTLNCNVRGEKDPDMQLCRIVGLDVGCEYTGQGGIKGDFLISGLSHFPFIDRGRLRENGLGED